MFLTNNFDLPALTIAQLYRCRWQVELFFKWIKQNLRIKAFYGNSVNAVKTQVWIAISVYVLVAILKQGAEARPQPHRNPPNPERDSFRENPHFSGTFDDFCHQIPKALAVTSCHYSTYNRTVLIRDLKSEI